jgi:NitT/TauT family transport system substrate-binding protein
MADVDRRKFLTVGAAAALFTSPAALSGAAAQQPVTIRVGKAITSSFPFAGLEIGVKGGVWPANGVRLEIVSFPGDARLQQALTAGSVDFGLGSGPAMGYASKGVPARAVAALADRPENMALVVSVKSNITSVDELKGKRIAVTTAGSLTDWLARALAQSKGWGPDGVEVVPMGEMRTRLAAMQSGDLPASVTATEQAFEIEEQGLGKVLMTFGEIVPHFHTHVIFARDHVIKNDPELVKKFLHAWFKTVRFMKDHKDVAVKTAADTMKVSEMVISRAYDFEMGMMSFDGKFDPQAIEIIRQSLKDLGIVDFVPNTKDMYTDQFVPVVVD